MKAERAAAKAASEAAKAKQKEALANQALYQSLFGAHAQLVADMAPVPLAKRSHEHYTSAQELAAKGEHMIDEALEAMRLKAELPKDAITDFTKEQKKLSGHMMRLSKKKAS